MKEGVLGFFRENRWLSNFALCEIEYEGIIYPSTENAYQASKFDNEEYRYQISEMTPSESKEFAKVHNDEVRKFFHQEKVYIMYTLLRQKFEIPFYKEKLLDLIENGEPKYIEETNWWKDHFWGVDINSQEGTNILGCLIMIVAKEISKNP